MSFNLAVPAPLDPATFVLDPVDTVMDAERIGYYPTATYSYFFVCQTIGPLVFNDDHLGTDVDPATQTWRADPETLPGSNVSQGVALPGRCPTPFPADVHHGGPWVHTMLETVQMANWGLNVLICVVPNLSMPPQCRTSADADLDESTFEQTRSIAMIALAAALTSQVPIPYKLVTLVNMGRLNGPI